MHLQQQATSETSSLIALNSITEKSISGDQNWIVNTLQTYFVVVISPVFELVDGGGGLCMEHQQQEGCKIDR